MIYAGNIFIALAAPLLIMVALSRGPVRRFSIFFILGLICCLLSAYINSFITAASGMNTREAVVKLTPVCEEIIKMLPVVFYLMVFTPSRRRILPAALAVGVGFATLENTVYLTQFGAGEFGFVLLRGFSAGVMHTICAAVLGYGLIILYKRGLLFYAGSFALLCVNCVYHATYNLLVSGGTGWQAAGTLLPVVSAAVLAAGIKLSRHFR